MEVRLGLGDQQLVAELTVPLIAIVKMVNSSFTMYSFAYSPSLWARRNLSLNSGLYLSDWVESSP